MKILIGSPVRITEPWQAEVFKLYLDALDQLERTENCTVDRMFVLHNSPGAKELVREGEVPGGRQFLAEVETKENYVCDENTHNWNTKSLIAVTAMRNYLLGMARQMDYDYYFMVDADLILHPETLTTLIAAEKDIVAEAFWTKWTPEDVPAVNAWDYDVYGFVPDRETRFAEFRTPGLYRIGMSGACIMIGKKALQAGLSYNSVQNLSLWGEDRAFCVRAACAGLEIWLDTHLPPAHLYRESEYIGYISNPAHHNVV